ncbi:MAG: PAS domain S-box protein [Chloroflexaceae bacterium]|nr:PAS domain S-box protein [Chloroflexaceae bacterium]
MKSFWRWLIQYNPTNRPVTLQQWREHLVEAMLRAGLVLGFFAVVLGNISVLKQIPTDWWPLAVAVVVIYSMVYATIFVLYQVPQLGFTWRAGGIIVVLYVTGVVDMMIFGLSGSARLFFFSCIVFATVFFSKRMSGAILLGILLTMLLLASLWVNGLLTIPMTMLANSTVLFTWVSSSMDFLLLTFVVVLVVTSLLQGIDQSLTLAGAHADALEALNARLEHLVDVRTAALRESEARYRLLADHATDMIARIDPDGRLLDVSPASIQLLGASPEAFTDTSMLDRIHPDDVSLFAESLQATTNQRWSVSYRVRHQDGHYIWCETTGQTITTDAESGQVVEMVTVSRDITARKEIEQELEASLSLLESVLESTPSGMIVVAHDGTLIRQNQRFLSIWQLDADWASGNSGAGHMQETASQVKDPTGFLARLIELQEHQEQEAYDMLALHDGRVIERYSAPYRLGDTIIGRVWSFQDVTSQKQAELAVQASQARLQALFDTITVGIAVFDPQGAYHGSE